MFPKTERYIEQRRERCRNCMVTGDNSRKHCYRISRFAGGSYNRPGRFYDSWICAECVKSLVPRIQGYAMERKSGFPARQLLAIKGLIDSE